MEQDNFSINYENYMEQSLTHVVRFALLDAEQRGIPSPLAFYISFITDYPGVQMPPFLKAKYPENITIVLQYEFSNLKVSDKEFGVTLSFDGRPYYILVPFAAILSFVDPGVNFALQFPNHKKEFERIMAEESLNGENQQELPYNHEKIVSLDTFRKKKP